MGSIYVICSRQCPNGDGIYTLLYALYKYSTSITNQPTNQRAGSRSAGYERFGTGNLAPLAVLVPIPKPATHYKVVVVDVLLTIRSQFDSYVKLTPTLLS